MNQSELETNAWSFRQVRENACEQITIGFYFTSDWLKKWRDFLNQSQSVVKQNQSKHD